MLAHHAGLELLLSLLDSLYHHRSFPPVHSNSILAWDLMSPLTDLLNLLGGVGSTFFVVCGVVGADLVLLTCLCTVTLV